MRSRLWRRPSELYTGSTAYGAAKAALINLTKSFARAYSAEGSKTVAVEIAGRDAVDELGTVQRPHRRDGRVLLRVGRGVGGRDGLRRGRSVHRAGDGIEMSTSDRCVLTTRVYDAVDSAVGLSDAAPVSSVPGASAAES